MAFGFGFNKAKVLASAERNVKAGKLQNAIADYEKIIKEEPKDLNVLNTIGDLYARLGKTDQATNYYKRVAEAFASSGFTVKAIAMYKKITKLDSSSVEPLARLAELYAQQGLHSDARSQYALVADHHLKAGRLDDAAHVFQKVLDLDPENATMQGKLAELYVRLGKKHDARDIYFRNAELYRSRKNFAAADESLKQVLAIDKGFSQAILLRGLVKMELGDAAGTIECLEQVSDIDSRPEGLRSMLKAYFKLGNLDAAGPLARKLYTVFQEAQGLGSYAEALVAAGRTEDALAFYTEFADVLFSTQGEAAIAPLQSCIARVKDNPACLEQLSGLLERAGQTTHLAEIKELLAHASVQAGDLAKARDLYRELARLEPDNPLHTQNYRQVLAKLGEDPSARALTAEEAAQPMLVDELEGHLPEIPQDYPNEVVEAVRAALTEAELFDSYNLPAKAVTPLEAIISRAPQHPQVNQRLASLYARTNRFADAAARCQVLEQIYKQAEHFEQAHEYADLAAKYAARAGTTLPAQSAPAAAAPIPTPAPLYDAKPEPPAVSTPPAFGFDEATHGPAKTGSVAEFEFVPSTPEAHAAPEPQAFELEFSATHAPEPPHAEVAAGEIDAASAVHVEVPTAKTETIPAVHAPEPPAATPTSPATVEFDLSSEWEDMVEVEEQPASGATEILEDHEAAPVESPAFELAAPVATEDTTPVSQVEVDAPVEFALEATGARDSSTDDSHAAIFEMLGASPESGYPEHIADLIEEIRFYVSQGMWDEARAGLNKLEREAPEAASDLRREIAAHHGSAEPAASALPIPAAIAAHDVVAEAEPPHVAEAAHEQVVAFAQPTVHEPEPVESVAFAMPAAHEPDPLEELAFEAPAASEPEPLPSFEFAAAAPQHENRHADSFESLLDLDSELGDDFEIAVAIPEPAHAVAAPAAISASAPQAMHAVAGAAVQTFVAPPVTSMAATAVATPPAPPQAPPPAGADVALDFSDGALADIFAEFKHDMEGVTTGTSEDPETHYNLGVAFKEMGLLDEAIGELQKVCQAIDRGEDFPQALQAYTWLADCFVQKGVPEASIRWYEKALHSPHVDADRSTAIHYEMACAFEMAGNRSGALTHFMEVYGANIDYRDVADRIKSLKS